MRPLIVRDNDFTVYIGGSPHKVDKTHPKYEEILHKVHDLSDSELLSMVSRSEGIKQQVRTTKEGKTGLVEVVGGSVTYGGEPMNGVIVDRILGMIERGLEIKPMLRFLDNLMQNPSRDAVNETYGFLEHNNLPVTDDGCFVAYKYLNADWTDCHTGKIKNELGKPTKQRRNTIDEDWRNLCSSGLHVGTYEYAFDGPGRIRVAVKVNPRDVVAVHAGEHKCRVCEYIPIEELVDKSRKLDDYFYAEANASQEGEVDDDYDEDDEWDYDDYDKDDDWDDDLDDEEEGCGDPDCDLCNESSDDDDWDEYGEFSNDQAKTDYSLFLSNKAKAQKRGPGGRFA